MTTPGDYRYPAPTDSVFNGVAQYVPLLLTAVDMSLDRPDVWEDSDADSAMGFMEDLKAWIQELTDFMFVPIGALLPHTSNTIPPGWLLCDGTQYARVDYPVLYAALNAAFIVNADNFIVPNLSGRVAIGTSLGHTIGTSGGAETHTLITAEMPIHTHVQDAHTHVQNSHNHTQNAHTHVQNSHNHTQNAHTHVQDSHNHTQNAHTHVQNGHQHNVLVIQNSVLGGSTAPPTSNGTGTALFEPLAQAVVATNQNTTPTNNATTAANQNTTAVNVAATATNQNTTPTNNAATAANQNTTAVNQNAGGDLAHNNMQPYLALPYIIRAQ